MAQEAVDVSDREEVQLKGNEMVEPVDVSALDTFTAPPETEVVDS